MPQDKQTKKNGYATRQNLREAIKVVQKGKFQVIMNGLPQEKRKISNKKPNLQANWVRKRRNKAKLAGGKK